METRSNQKYNQTYIHYFNLYDIDGIDMNVTATFAAGDIVISQDEGVQVNTTNLPTNEGSYYSLVLTAAEMQAAKITIIIIDQTAPKVWLDIAFMIETYGNLSAEHAFDLDTATQDVNIVSISGGTTAADNLEAMYDGTGYIDDTAPASRSQIASIGSNGGSALNFQVTEDNTGVAIKGIPFIGIQTGTFVDTEAEDGVYHAIVNVADEIDIVYGINVGGSRTAINILHTGWFREKDDLVSVQAYNFVDSIWETRTIIVGQGGAAGSVNVSRTIPLLIRHTGEGAEAGQVYIRYTSTAPAVNNPQLNIDQLLISATTSQTSIGYEGGAVWLDTSGSNTNTVPYVDGTADNPVSTIDAARNLADALNIKVIHALPDSVFTLTTAFVNFEFIGAGYRIDLGGQDVSGCVFELCAVSGVGLSPTNRALFRECVFGSGISIQFAGFLGCSLAGVFNLTSAGVYIFNNCSSGAESVSISFDALVGDTELNIRNYSGGITLESMGTVGTDIASIDGNGQVIEGTCVGGIVTIIGNFTVSDITNLTILDDARYDMLQVRDSMKLAPSVGVPSIGSMDYKLDSMNALIDVLIKYESNRSRIDKTANTLTIFDDDGVTVLQIFNLFDGSGTPSTAEVCERVPV